jgi:NAD(P)H-dependent FMN reductase
MATEADYKRLSKAQCGAFEKYLYQYIAGQYLSSRTPYRSLLLYHGLGTGKTCSAITFAEAFLKTHRVRSARAGGAEPSIWVVASPALQRSFTGEIYSAAKGSAACTGDLYTRFFPNADTLEPAILSRRMKALIESRYRFISYDGLQSLLEGPTVIKDKVIIVDEAHNVRNDIPAFAAALRRGSGNRLLLLSATPMFNEPAEILGLMDLMLANDGRTSPFADGVKLFRTAKNRNVEVFKQLEQLTAEYVSFLKGANPITFAPRLSPSVNGVPMLTVEQREWTSHIRDGVVPSILGSVQKKWWVEHMPKYAQLNAQPNAQADGSSVIPSENAAQTQLMQGTNITYPTGTIGRKGFFQVFKSIERPDLKSLHVEYATHVNALRPGAGAPGQGAPGQGAEGLGACAAKLQRIVDFIQQAEGIVMVYSEYVWSGVVPLAIALEHIGYNRFGENNLLGAGGGVVKSKAKKKGLTYAILSGTAEVMGRRSIAEILTSVNAPENRSGTNVKVVLLTQIASEGLTLKNVREVHILEPWYHMHQVEQVIGRAVRTCSHQGLELEDRNVTVYLHCAVEALEAGARQTPDEHAYEISSRKEGQVKIVEQVLRNRAMDCALNLDANYIPKELFGFKARLRTSQGTRLEWAFGDDAAEKPKCKTTLSEERVVAAPTFGDEIVMPTALARLAGLLRESQGTGGKLTLSTIEKALGFPKHIVRMTIAKAIDTPEFVQGHMLALHRDTLVVVKTGNREPGQRLLVVRPTEKTEAASAGPSEGHPNHPHAPKPSMDILIGQVRLLPDDPIAAKFTLFSIMTRPTFTGLVEGIIRLAHEKGALPVELERVSAIFKEEGILIGMDPKAHAKGFIGYIDIFTPRKELEIYVYYPKRHTPDTFERASQAQTDAVRAARTFQDIPMKVADLADVVGYFALKRDTRRAEPDAKLDFHLLTPNTLKGDQRGALCETRTLSDLKVLLNTVAPGLYDGLDAETREQLEKRKQICGVIGQALDRKAGRMQMMYPPYWKA